ncbi:Protein gts1 [Paraconiothyrium brasiliense]|uniref:Protein gts1 n=1 Tax=Paraconiothyrium brasiliense TaxID=300254 RepID=A0ABR3QUA0_9PLEO
MASVLNKRQQARNERTLQDLIKNVPGNSVGIFLCMRCAALHRKLGTHISKVKSLSMDKWDSAQVDNMKRIGNTESNKTYNPRNVKAQIPIDIDEVDGAMERYIRQKYEQRLFMTDSRPGTRSNTGSSSSVEDRPPPLPPKPTKGLGFGLRKASTQYKSVTPPISPGISNFSGHDASPPRVNKPSRVFGSSVTGDGLDSKLATLRDMGFPDDKRNAQVLKGLNGNLDRAVEALIRLGEQNPGKSRGNTPTPPDKLDVNGLMLNKAHTMPATTTTTSTNPFDALDAVASLPQQQPPQVPPIQTQQQHPYGESLTQPTSPNNPFHQFASQQQGSQFQQQAYQQPQNFTQSNPFGQQQQSLEQSFQGLQLSSQQQQQQPPPQPLFPNRTGSYAQQPNPPFAQSNPFQQSFTPPPIPQMPPQYASFYQQSQSPPPQPQYQSMSSPNSPGNPFLKSTRSQMFTPTSSYNANPFGPIPAQQQYQQQAQIQPHQTGNPFMMQQQNQTPTHQVPNPYQSQQGTNAQSQFNYAQQAHAQQSHNPFDKKSILALYNQPQLAPQQPQQAQTPAVQTSPSAPAVQSAGHMNPFAAMQSQAGAQQPASAIPQQIQQGSRHVSNDSVDFAGLMGGRHSPDAFSGLSSSFRR